MFLVLDTHSGKQNQDALKGVNGSKTVDFIDKLFWKNKTRQNKTATYFTPTKFNSSTTIQPL